MDSNTSHPLATESFSYSWLETESHHKTISNSRNNSQSLLFDETTHNFYFDISNSKSNPTSPVHADKLFSNGLILPRFLDEPSKNNNATNSIIGPSSTPPSPLLANSKIHHHHHHPSSSFRRMFLGKWSRFIPRKIFSKYVKCLVPMKETIGRGATKVDDVNRLTWEVKNWSTNNTHEVASSPRSEIGAYSSAWSDIDESSIRDAIIYCKRSSGLC